MNTILNKVCWGISPKDMHDDYDAWLALAILKYSRIAWYSPILSHIDYTRIFIFYMLTIVFSLFRCGKPGIWQWLRVESERASDRILWIHCFEDPPGCYQVLDQMVGGREAFGNRSCKPNTTRKSKFTLHLPRFFWSMWRGSEDFCGVLNGLCPYLCWWRPYSNLTTWVDLPIHLVWQARHWQSRVESEHVKGLPGHLPQTGWLLAEMGWMARGPWGSWSFRWSTCISSFNCYAAVSSQEIQSMAIWSAWFGTGQCFATATPWGRLYEVEVLDELG